MSMLEGYRYLRDRYVNDMINFLTMLDNKEELSGFLQEIKYLETVYNYLLRHDRWS